MPSAVRSSPFPAVALVSEASQYGFDLRTVEVAVCNESKRIERRPFLGFSTNQRQLALRGELPGAALKRKTSVIFAKI